MGHPRKKTRFLGAKLTTIRKSLGYTQVELGKQLDPEDDIPQSLISRYEKGELEPPTPNLLQYARLANVYVDVLIDDGLDLPARLPCTTKHEGIPHKKLKARKPPVA